MAGRIGIISYLPDELTIRNVRYKMMQTQSSWILGTPQLSNWRIYMVAQNYHKLSIPDNYAVIRQTAGIGPSRARNLLLADFYNSDDDWMLCLDDDVMLTDKYESYQIFSDILHDADKFSDVDMITGVFGRFQPYSHLNTNRDVIIKNWTFLPRGINTPGNIILLRNLKKYYDNPIYYRDIGLASYSGREDMSFLVDCIVAGYKCYQCNQLITRNLGEIKSCLFDWESNSHAEQVKHCLEGFLELHSDKIYRNSNGTVNYKDFNRKYNKARSSLILPRTCPIQNPEDAWFIVNHRKRNNRRRSLF